MSTEHPGCAQCEVPVMAGCAEAVEAADTVEEAVGVLGSIGGDTQALGAPTESASGG